MPEDGAAAQPGARTFHCDDEGLFQAAEALRAGRIIAYPTETQYGLGVDALDAPAVANLRIIKGKPDGTFLVVIDQAERVSEFASEVSETATIVMQTCWPGPVTVLLPARDGLPDGIVGDEGLVGVRVPDHEVPRKLSGLVASPLVSTSANRTGWDPLLDGAEIAREFAAEVAVVLDAGALRPGPGSTVVDARRQPLQVVRSGAVSPNGIARRTGLEVAGGKAVPLVMMVCTGNTCRSPLAEGLLASHLRSRELEGALDVESAGVAAVSWGKAVEESQAVAWESGIDISGHRPRQLTPAMVREADMLIVMNERHRMEIARMSPEAADRTFILDGLTAELKGKSPGSHRQISDPYGRPLKAYRKVFNQMRKELESSLETILSRASDRRIREQERLSALAAGKQGEA